MVGTFLGASLQLGIVPPFTVAVGTLGFMEHNTIGNNTWRLELRGCYIHIRIVRGSGAGDGETGPPSSRHLVIQKVFQPTLKRLQEDLRGSCTRVRECGDFYLRVRPSCDEVTVCAICNGLIHTASLSQALFQDQFQYCGV
ncbi:hypothetical protein DFH27DRAFT_537678 [Peziza echinospora]|nr:hypothetical protein DFH27DRAFT_537678 [Peziza echinospora]